MAYSKGTVDQDIGRPESSRESRYQNRGQPAEQSVRPPPRSSPGHGNRMSTPLTRKEPAVTESQGKSNSVSPVATQVNSVTTWYRKKRLPDRQ